MNKHYAEGERAYANGALKSDNPYKSDTEHHEWASWRKGWIDSHDNDLARIARERS